MPHAYQHPTALSSNITVVTWALKLKPAWFVSPDSQRPKLLLVFLVYWKNNMSIRWCVQPRLKAWLTCLLCRQLLLFPLLLLLEVGHLGKDAGYDLILLKINVNLIGVWLLAFKNAIYCFHNEVRSIWFCDAKWSRCCGNPYIDVHNTLDKKSYVTGCSEVNLFVIGGKNSQNDYVWLRTTSLHRCNKTFCSQKNYNNTPDSVKT